ncbi:dehydrogenase/reductase SDR family member 12-like isoform X1 [Alosa alosa]|uniref:dehydrogenase/reductase SDR family member 12-like isoform X1 n=1 Tax=Alosa alosa TaxID=278164 RepID=UPI00201509C3|nr:dehydrogenase/reductase SDR family member 12-like isoform X1 [Alosa alosa]
MSKYRNIVWFLKAMQEYTRGGYETASKHFVVKDLSADLGGRSFMITGANSGIGKATAMAIAKKVGGTVHMVCRNKERAESAREDIVKESGNNNVHVHILDLSESRKVWEFTEDFKSKHSSLNVLINNAGSMVNIREVNFEGFEKNFAINTLGVYILTKGLIPLLEKSSEPRVITVSSGGMLVQKLRIIDLQTEKRPFDSTMVYAQNKRQQVVMTEEWAQAYPKIHFSVMHPGWADTPAVAKAIPDFYERLRSRLRSPEQGADTVIWLAISPAAARMPSGKFFQDRKMVPVHLPLAWTRYSREKARALMVRLEALAKRAQPSAGRSQLNCPIVDISGGPQDCIKKAA